MVPVNSLACGGWLAGLGASRWGGCGVVHEIHPAWGSQRVRTVAPLIAIARQDRLHGRSDDASADEPPSSLTQRVVEDKTPL